MSRSRLLGNALLLAGVAIFLSVGVSYFLDPSQGGRNLPRAIALDMPTPTPTATAVPTATPLPATVTAAPTSTATPTPTPSHAGVPVRMVIPSAEVDSEVKEVGIVMVNGEARWETIPFYVGHYRETALVGDKGNAVFSGHVTSRTLGNVFLNLYQVNLGDEVTVYTKDHEFVYVVNSVKEVPPTDISAMDPTPDPTITLITCAGDWLDDRKDYSRRLIVKAKLKN